MLDAIFAATFLVTSRDPRNDNFGTAFLVHRDQWAATFLTAAHVVADVGGQNHVLVAHRPVSVAAMGSPESAVDMAVLQWEAEATNNGATPDAGAGAHLPGWPNQRPFKLETAEQRGSRIIIVGQKRYESPGKFRLKALFGNLGQFSVYDSQKIPGRVKGWELALDEGSSLDTGYSGAPVVDSGTGNVVALVTHRIGKTGGLAISIDLLKKLWIQRPEGLTIRHRGRSLKPKLLPQLADREPQISAIEKHIIMDRPCPNVWVIHGEQHESLDNFLECLGCHHLPRLVHHDENCADLREIYFNWPQGCTSYDDFHEQVMHQLRNSSRIAHGKPEELMLAINNSTNAALLLWSRIYSRDWQTYGDKLIQYLLSLSHNWPQRAGGKLLIICLLVKYIRKSPKGIFKHLSFGRGVFDKHNRRMHEYFVNCQGRPQRNFDITGHILPEMQSITQKDAENWTEHPEIKNKYTNIDFISAIRDMFADCEELPMANFAEGIRKLIGME